MDLTYLSSPLFFFSPDQARGSPRTYEDPVCAPREHSRRFQEQADPEFLPPRGCPLSKVGFPSFVCLFVVCFSVPLWSIDRLIDRSIVERSIDRRWTVSSSPSSYLLRSRRRASPPLGGLRLRRGPPRRWISRRMDGDGWRWRRWLPVSRSRGGREREERG